MLPAPAPRPFKATLRWLVAALVAVVLLFALMAFTARSRPSASLVENVLNTALYPFQAAAGWVANRVSAAAGAVWELVRVYQENARLRAEVEELKQLRTWNDVLAAENERLRDELGLRARVPYRLLAAEVIERHPDAWFQEVVINRGQRDGVQAGMAVINSQGLVGRVERTAYATATVRLISDREFLAAVRAARTGEDGILRGQGPEGARVDFNFCQECQVAPGDEVVASGLGPYVPGGLRVGTVVRVDRESHNLTRYAIVRPSADLRRLDFVQVVLSRPGDAGGGGGR